MKALLDIVMVGGFVLFLIFLVRGFVLQVQERQRQREEEQNSKKK